MRYTLIEELGRGAMGTVWLAEGPRGRVALKLVDEQATPLADVAREIQAMARLTHPNVVTIYDHGELEGQPFVAMELASGTLQSALDSGLVRSWSAVRDVLTSVLEGLAHAHSRGLLHRDVKPENILAIATDAGPRWVLSDFGIAHPLGQDGKSESPVGTPGFMPPEQFVANSRDFTPASDLYAVGCLAHYMVTGRAPFPGKTFMQLFLQHLQEPPRMLQPKIAVPHGFEAWLHRLLEKSPSDRFSLAADARRVLGDLRLLDSVNSDVLVGFEFEPQMTVRYNPPDETEVVDGVSGRFEIARASRTRAEMGQVAPKFPEDWRDVERPVRVAREQSLLALRQVPLVGREALQDELWARLRQVRGRQATDAVRLRGAAGNGKSRVGFWLAETAHEAGVAFSLVLRHDDDPRKEIFLDALAAATGTSRLGYDARRDRLKTLFAPADALPDWAVDALASAFGGKESDGFSVTRSLLACAVQELFLRWTSERPWIVLVDDAQWADASADLLNALHASNLPILFVDTIQLEAHAEREAFPEELNAWLEVGEQFDVNPLTPAAVGALFDEMLELRDATRERLIEKVGGNPLFATQLINDLVDRGLLREEGRKLHVVSGAELELPTDLAEVWLARVERFLDGRPTDDRIALEIAALAGPVVGHELVRGVARAMGYRPSADLVNALVQHRLAVHEREEWSFIHGMLRESIRAGVVRRGRANAVHRAIGDWYWNGKSFFSEIHAVHHWVEGEAFERLVTDGPRVVEALFDRDDQSYALPVVDAVEYAAGMLGLSELRLQSRFQRAGAHLLGTIATGRQELADARAELERGEFGAKTHAFADFAAARLAYVDGDMQGTIDAIDRGWDRLRGVGISPPRWVPLRRADALAYMNQMSEALNAYLYARSVAEEAGDVEQVALADFGIGWIWHEEGADEQAEELLRKAVASLARVGNRHLEWRVMATLGDVLRALGRPEEALDVYLEAHEGFESVFPGHVSMLVNLALAYRDLRQWDEFSHFMYLAENSDHWSANAPNPRRILTALQVFDAARRRDWNAFDEVVGRMESIWDAADAFESDTFQPLADAATLAKAAGEDARAARALKIETAYRERVGRT